MPKDQMLIIGEISPYLRGYIVTMHAIVTLSPLFYKCVEQHAFTKSGTFINAISRITTQLENHYGCTTV